MHQQPNPHPLWSAWHRDHPLPLASHRIHRRRRPPHPTLSSSLSSSSPATANGLADSGWNAWIGDMAHGERSPRLPAPRAMALAAPLRLLSQQTLVTKAGLMWYEFYYIMIGLALVEVIFAISVFWRANGAAYRNQHRQQIQAESATTPEDGLGNTRRNNRTDSAPVPNPNPKGGLFRLSSATKASSPTAEAVTNRITWLCSLFPAHLRRH